MSRDLSKFYFCESLAAGRDYWHIREVSDKGPRFSGGADTLALCGRKVGWDIQAPQPIKRINAADCPKCIEKFTEIQKEQAQ